MSEPRYRVWVEKCQRSWIEVSAPNEDIARDRARLAAYDRGWTPQWEGVTPCTAELIAPPEDR